MARCRDERGGMARLPGRRRVEGDQAPHERPARRSCRRDRGPPARQDRVLTRDRDSRPLRVGKLYLVATPIGNLEDVSLRGLRILQEAHMVACEDTRHTQILLRKHDIRAKHLTAYTEFNHKRKVAELVGQLDRGWDVALVSDAGTPALSDPGEQLVRAAVAAGHAVVAIPGPAAAIAALVASGLPTREFTFVGFVEKKTGPRRRVLERLIAEGRTVVLYESPYRVGDLLAD